MSTAPHVFWIASRAAGSVALLLSSVAVGLGVTMAGGLIRGRRPELRVAHEALSLGTMAALLVHAVTLLGDQFLKPSVADLTVPFASSYMQPWMGIGVIGGWMILLFGLSYYVRDRVGQARWKRIHRLTVLAWALGVVHSLGIGTDSGQVWFLITAGVVAVPAFALVASRVTRALSAPKGAL